MVEIEPVLLATNLHKTYDGRAVVDAVSFTVQRGEIVGLLGPNGAGKTTTLEMIEGLRSPDGGDVRIFGSGWKDAGRSIRERIGIQLQSTALLPNLTVVEALQTQASLYQHPASIESLIERLGLGPKRKALTGQLSGGQLQRLAIGLALAGSPELVFLDEPTAGLDPSARLELWGLVQELRVTGVSVLLTTHYLEEAETLCDRIVIMDRGRVIASGTLADLVERAGLLQRVVFPPHDHLDADQFARLAGVERVTKTTDSIALSTRDLGETLFDLLALNSHRRELPTGLTVRQPTLEEVFLELTGRPLAA